jgi:UDP-N-acetyl-D-mannosaminouronate:lipid I N-acetyl-D-mannosaminouronosyltransferase
MKSNFNANFNKLAAIKVGKLSAIPFKSMDDILSFLFNSDGSVIKGMLIAINPEKVMHCENDAVARDAILQADIPYADGIGVVKVLERKVQSKLSRIPGVELWLELMKKSKQSSLPVYLVGAKQDVLAKSVNKLKLEHQVNIVGFTDGYFKDEEKLIASIKSTKPAIVTVALGSPRQELFMKRCQDAGIEALFMGVGGSYDVYAGYLNRAPLKWQSKHLEWLYRLIKEPKRIKRQLPLLKFVYLYFFNRL